jgi:PAS domain S-box-containing protein
VRWVQILKSPVRDAARQIIGTQVLFWDVTAKHAAEEALREGTALKRAIFDSALDCIAIVDQDGSIIDLNRSAERVFGYSCRELLGANIDDTLFPPTLKERQRSNRSKSGDESEEGSLLGKRVEVPAMRKDGRSFDVEMAMQPVPYQGRTVFAMFLHDITERKKAEEEIAQMNSDLQTLLYVTSHDLREPLRAIRSFSQLLTDRVADRLGDTERGFLQRVIDGADRLDRLLEDVLTLSRAQRAADAMDEVAASVVIDDVIRQLDVRIAETEAEITVADVLPNIRADVRWLRQSLFNLVANALKFTNDGEAPHIEISPYEPRRDDEQPLTGLIVSDRGPGVDPAHSERIFQLFQRAVGRKVEGTGAGLAIVRQVANRYGGNAWVEPREGGGSNFFITFAR